MAGLTPSDSLFPSDTLFPADVPLPGGKILDDYEFTAGVQNHYRVRVYDEGGALLHTYTDDITPLLSAPWLKSVARPYLNRSVMIAEAGDFGRRARVGVFDIVGARRPIAVSDVRGGRTYSLTIQTSTADEADAIDALLDGGEVLFLQTPDGYPVPTGYYSVGDSVRSWRNAPPAQVPLRWHTLPLTEAAPPDPSIVGATTTWAAVAARYATWADVVANVATWNDLADAVAGVGDVVVDMA